MNKIFLITICIFTFSVMQAQQDKATDKDRQIFYFEQFQDGLVYYDGDQPSGGKLNYNFRTQTVQFMSEGTILDLTVTRNLTHVIIGKTTFVPVTRGFGTVIYDGEVTLLKEKHLIVETIKRGGYGNVSNTSAVQNINQIEGGGSTTELDLETDYKIKNTYYLMKNKKTYLANKRGFTRCFSDKKDQINEYYKTTSFAADDEEALIKFLDVLTGRK